MARSGRQGSVDLDRGPQLRLRVVGVRDHLREPIAALLKRGDLGVDLGQRVVSGAKCRPFVLRVSISFESSGTLSNRPAT